VDPEREALVGLEDLPRGELIAGEAQAALAQARAVLWVVTDGEQRDGE
jgi:hypothetical protein